MARKKKEVIEEVTETPVEVVETPVEEIVEVTPADALIGKRWEMTSETITGVVGETDTYWTVSVSDGCTYHLAK